MYVGRGRQKQYFKSSRCGLDMLGLNVVLVLLLMLRATATDGQTVLFVVIVIYCDAKHSI